MKKTLFGVLAFVLVLATVLTGSVMAVASDDTKNVATVPMVSKEQPIQVDGLMDIAYASCTPLEVGFYSNTSNSVYTYAEARFAWSADRNALYCYVIVNDADLAQPGAWPWETDSVELFVDWENNGKQNWGIDAIPETLTRGLQYRISSTGQATCYLDATGEKYTYEYNTVDKKWTYTKDHYLITDTANIFGWNHNPDDDSNVKKGFAYKVTDYGYAVEFQMQYSQGTLTAGKQLGVDIQLNDRYTDIKSGSTSQANVYYSGTYRVKSGSYSSGNNCQYYDYITLGDKTVANDRSVAAADMGDYGMAEATSRTTTAKQTERTTTQKVTIDRVHTYNTNTTTKKPDSGNAPSGGSTTTTTTVNGGDTTSSGGCGSSLAVGSSVAMVALIGAAGFLTFRRKKDNDND